MDQRTGVPADGSLAGVTVASHNPFQQFAAQLGHHIAGAGYHGTRRHSDLGWICRVIGSVCLPRLNRRCFPWKFGTHPDICFLVQRCHSPDGHPISGLAWFFSEPRSNAGYWSRQLFGFAEDQHGTRCTSHDFFGRTTNQRALPACAAL